MTKILTFEVPITAINKERIDEEHDLWRVAVLIDHWEDEYHIQASRKYIIEGRNEIPYREDYVTVKYDVHTKESWIIDEF